MSQVTILILKHVMQYLVKGNRFDACSDNVGNFTALGNWNMHEHLKKILNYECFRSCICIDWILLLNENLQSLLSVSTCICRIEYNIVSESRYWIPFISNQIKYMYPLLQNNYGLYSLMKKDGLPSFLRTKYLLTFIDCLSA